MYTVTLMKQTVPDALVSRCKQSHAQSTATYLLHAVIHRQKRLQSFPLQHVGELHVNWLHGSNVTHDPVFVWVWSVVITGSSGGGGRRIKVALM